MINPQHLPTMHKEFSAIKKALSEKKKEKNKEFLNLLNRFMYRYRMAKAFKTIVAVDVEKRTVDGYACGMKLFMAYSAYDELREAERTLINGERLKTHTLRNKELAERIRKNTKMKEHKFYHIYIFQEQLLEFCCITLTCALFLINQTGQKAGFNKKYLTFM